MCGYEQVIVMDVEIVCRRDRQVVLQGLPVPAVVPGEEHAALRTRVEQASAFVVFAHRVHVLIKGTIVESGPPEQVARSARDDVREFIEASGIDKALLRGGREAR